MSSQLVTEPELPIFRSLSAVMELRDPEVGATQVAPALRRLSRYLRAASEALRAKNQDVMARADDVVVRCYDNFHSENP